MATKKIDNEEGGSANKGSDSKDSESLSLEERQRMHNAYTQFSYQLSHHGGMACATRFDDDHHDDDKARINHDHERVHITTRSGKKPENPASWLG